MVAPLAEDLQVFFRESFLDETQAPDECDGGEVVGLDIGFDAVQAHFLEGYVEHEAHGLGHFALSLMPLPDPIAAVRALEAAEKYLAQSDESDGSVVGKVQDGPGFGGGGLHPVQQVGKLIGVPGRVHPWMVQFPALDGQCGQCGAVLWLQGADGDAAGWEMQGMWHCWGEVD